MVKVDVYKVLVDFNAPLTTSGARTGVTFSNNIPIIALGSDDYIIVHSSDFEDLTVFAKKDKTHNLVPVELSEEFVQKNLKLFKKVI